MMAHTHRIRDRVMKVYSDAELFSLISDELYGSEVRDLSDDKIVDRIVRKLILRFERDARISRIQTRVEAELRKQMADGWDSEFEDRQRRLLEQLPPYNGETAKAAKEEK